MAVISADDLRPGDWLVLLGDPHSWISKAIMMLTNSDVSHAVLYIGDGKVAEEGHDGLVTMNVDQRLDRAAYVMRRQTPHPDLTPVIDTARDYLAEGEKYAFGNLVLLGLILLYKRVAIGSLRRKVMVRIFKAAALVIFKLNEKYRYEGKTPMVCSQFVYECFARPSAKDPAYRLDLEHPLLMAAHTRVEESLLDALLRYRAPAALALKSAGDDIGVDADPEELARDLVTALETAPETEVLATEAAAGVDDELYVAAREFAAVAAPLFAGSQPPSTEGALVMMADRKSYFVAPSDLLAVRNGQLVGTIPAQPSA